LKKGSFLGRKRREGGARERYLIEVCRGESLSIVTGEKGHYQKKGEKSVLMPQDQKGRKLFGLAIKCCRPAGENGI